LIDLGDRLEVAREWEAVDGPPDSLVAGRGPDRLLYPAIAIPVEAKPDFECPADHVAALKRRIGQGIERMLVVGWRASEQMFLEMLRERPPLHAMIVTEDASTGAEPLRNLEGIGMAGKCEIVVGGFSAFSVSRDLDKLLTGPPGAPNPGS